jgi:hypothetical protein
VSPDEAASTKGATKAPAEKTPGVDGDLVPAGKGDGGAQLVGRVEIDWDEEARAVGTLTAGPERLTLSGIKEGSNLRLWVHSAREGGADIRRGFLWGVLDGGSAAGEVTISGSGGEPVVKASWKGRER